MAVGIAAFAIVSIMGLLTVSLTTTRESVNDTLVVNMAEHVLAEMRQQPFSRLVSSLTAVTTTNYFDDQGKALDSQTNTGFVCRVTSTPDASTLNPDTSLQDFERVGLLRVRLDFSQAGRAEVLKTVQSAVANY